MQTVTINCDLCRKTTSLSVEIQIGSKLHDLCMECNDKLTKLLSGTGKQVNASPSIYNNGWLKASGITIDKLPNSWANKKLSTPLQVSDISMDNTSKAYEQFMNPLLSPANNYVSVSYSVEQ